MSAPASHHGTEGIMMGGVTCPQAATSSTIRLATAFLEQTGSRTWGFQWFDFAILISLRCVNEGSIAGSDFVACWYPVVEGQTQSRHSPNHHASDHLGHHASPVLRTRRPDSTTSFVSFELSSAS
eukprot:3614904-Rhodomonas_salina.2